MDRIQSTRQYRPPFDTSIIGSAGVLVSWRMGAPGSLRNSSQSKPGAGIRYVDEIQSQTLGGLFKKSDKGNTAGKMLWRPRFYWGFDIIWKSNMK